MKVIILFKREQTPVTCIFGDMYLEFIPGDSIE